MMGSVVAFFYGLVNLNDYVQIGGNEGYILGGGWVVLGAAAMFFGVGTLMAGLVGGNHGEVPRGANPGRIAIGLGLIAVAATIWVGQGEKPREFCDGDFRCMTQ